MATKKKKNVKKANKVIKKKTAKKAAKKKTFKKVTKKTVKKVAEKNIKKIAKKSNPKPINKTKKTAKKTQTKSLVKTEKTLTKAVVDYSKAITPLGDRLVVKVVSAEKVTAGGLIIPDTASSIAKGYLKAKVMAVGSGGKNKKGSLKPLDVKVGDTVLFSEYSGTKITFNSEDLQIIHEADVMGIVEN